MNAVANTFVIVTRHRFFVGLSFFVGWQPIAAIHTCGDFIIVTVTHVAIMSMLLCEGTMLTILPTVASADDMWVVKSGS